MDFPNSIDDSLSKIFDVIYQKGLNGFELRKLLADILVEYSLSCELDSQWRKERDDYHSGQLGQVHVD